MSTTIAIWTTGYVPSQLYDRLGSVLANNTGPLFGVGRSGEVRIETYTPFLRTANAWLSIVEERIRTSIQPAENDGEESTEWLNSHAAAEAISFFQRVADLLPTEPHIAATRSGDLVAEFETPTYSLTSVVSDKDTILFGVSSSDPNNPIQIVIRRGSNRLREELKSFMRELHSVSHGKEMAASR